MARRGKVVEPPKDLETSDGNRFPSEPPKEETTQIYSIHEAMGHIHDLTVRVEATERLINLFLLQGINPVLKGFRLLRCRCTYFATKAFTVINPHAGNFLQFTCDKCPVDHPVARVSTSTVTESQYGNPEVVAMARELNERLDKALKDVV